MKRILVIFAFIITNSVIAQVTDWKLYSAVDGVEIYTIETDCFAKNIPDQKAVIIKVVNTTNEDKTVEWDKVLWYNGEKITHDVGDDENHYSVTITKNATQEGSCDTPYGPFYIYKDFITYDAKSKLTKFELENIKVSRL
jgi:hypothetical protein